MGLDNYRGSKTDEQKMREEQDWMDKTESIRVILDDTEIIDRYMTNYDLTGEVCDRILGQFLTKKDITNGLLQSVDEYEEELVKLYSNVPEKDERYLSTCYNSLKSAVMRLYAHKDDREELTDELGMKFIESMRVFLEELKKALLEKHGLSENGGK